MCSKDCYETPKNFHRLPNVLILFFQRKNYEVDEDSTEINRTPITINKQLTIGKEVYTLRSIVFHQGTDQNVFGHYVCHCLVKFRPKVITRGATKEFGQCFLFDEDQAIPISQKNAVDHEQVK